VSNLKISEMSDDDIRWAVIQQWFGQTETDYLNDKSATVFDVLHRWEDVIPIAEKYNIVLMLDYSGAKNPNPKRAICEVYLMMEIEE